MSDMTRGETRQAFLRSDREDLLMVLALRFGPVPESVQARIVACDDAAALERWILVAANAPDWAHFLKDLDDGPNVFRQVAVRDEPQSAMPGAPSPSRTAREPNDSAGVRPKEG